MWLRVCCVYPMQGMQWGCAESYLQDVREPLGRTAGVVGEAGPGYRLEVGLAIVGVDDAMQVDGGADVYIVYIYCIYI